MAKNAPDVSVPEIINSWVNHNWNRYFLILKWVGGRTLQDTWPRLSLPQMSQITTHIANYYSMLASIASYRCEIATYRGVLEL